MTVHSIDEIGCPSTFPTRFGRLLRTHHFPTEDVRSLSGSSEVAHCQLLLFSGMNNFYRGSPGRETLVAHPVAQTTIMELPEADSPTAIAHSRWVPMRLVPGISQRTCDQFVTPARSF